MKYTREGGFRSPLVARLTNGKVGLGRWTQAELDDIKERAEMEHRKFRELFEPMPEISHEHAQRILNRPKASEIQLSEDPEIW